jgi:dimeric dUTPase (all-alpha-NTP-PPase superfamily)
MKTTLLTKYKMALVKAHETEKLQRHVLGIKHTIEKLESGESPSVFEEVWIEYFGKMINLSDYELEYLYTSENAICINVDKKAEIKEAF